MMKKDLFTTCCLLLLSMLLCGGSLYAAHLSFDLATGRLFGFDLSEADSPDTPSSYATSASYYEKHGFIGRIVYSGPATQMVFSQVAPVATGTPTPPMFYFTYQSGATTQTGTWSEYFLVGKVRGGFHNMGKAHVDIVSTNTVIDSAMGRLAIPESSGSEKWEKDEGPYWGYNQNGLIGLKVKGLDFYSYKHKYRSIWIDLVAIRRNQAQHDALPNGQYVSNLIISTTEGGLVLPLSLHGEKNSEGPPRDFLFSFESAVPSLFPFENLANKNSITNSLPIGSVSYVANNASSTPAKIIFTSDRSGFSTDFKLYSPGVPPIPYKVVFASITTANGNGLELIEPPSKAYEAERVPQQSPIDNVQFYQQVIAGDVRIFIQPNTTPAAGTYSSTIYCNLIH